MKTEIVTKAVFPDGTGMILNTWWKRILPRIIESSRITSYNVCYTKLLRINLEFEENKKIVQQWFFGDDTEDSIVTIKLHPNKKGTSIELLHTNIPEDAYENISEGWDEDYFGALNELFI